MENNVYTAPEAELIDGTNTDEIGKHYILPQSKLWTFSLLTFGLFLVPWSYIHWRRIKLNEDSDIWPVPRALFSIFFVNSLFTKFEISKLNVSAQHRWSPSGNAAAYIIFSIIGNILDRIYDSTSIDIGIVYWVLFICSWIIPVLNISNAQRVANIAANDPRGESNSRWSTGNYLWMAVILVVWVLVFVGILYGDI